MSNIYDIGYLNWEAEEESPAIIQGATFQIPFTVTNIFAEAGAGCTISGNLTNDETGEVTAFSAVISNTTADILSGMASLSATVTTSLPLGKYFYTLKIQDTSGFVFELLKGKAKVTL